MQKVNQVSSNICSTTSKLWWKSHSLSTCSSYSWNIYLSCSKECWLGWRTNRSRHFNITCLPREASKYAGKTRYNIRTPPGNIQSECFTSRFSVEKLFQSFFKCWWTFQGDQRYETTAEIRGQLRFIEELDKLEKKRHEEAEREVLLRAAKVHCVANWPVLTFLPEFPWCF